MVVELIPKRKPKHPLKAHVPPLHGDSLRIVNEEYVKAQNLHLSMTELIAFVFDDTNQLLDNERGNICVELFGFPSIQHSMLLVEFYTGLPDATQFCYVSSMLQRTIFRDYIQWKNLEKQGFLTHTMMTLMKLRLGMTDEELADRFHVEPHIINMTMRLWIPALYKHIYTACEDLYRRPAPYNTEQFTKVIDVVEVCREVPEYTRKWRRGRHQIRRAVLVLRSENYVCFASDLLSEHVPEELCILRSKFRHVTTDQDVVLAHPEHQPALNSLGITCGDMTEDAAQLIQTAADSIADFKILAAIPEEYASFASQIYKICATLVNFHLRTDEE